MKNIGLAIASLAAFYLAACGSSEGMDSETTSSTQRQALVQACKTGVAAQCDDAETDEEKAECEEYTGKCETLPEDGEGQCLAKINECLSDAASACAEKHECLRTEAGCEADTEGQQCLDATIAKCADPAAECVTASKEAKADEAVSCEACVSNFEECTKDEELADEPSAAVEACAETAQECFAACDGDEGMPLPSEGDEFLPEAPEGAEVEFDVENLPTVPEGETQTEEMPLPDGVEAPKDDDGEFVFDGYGIADDDAIPPEAIVEIDTENLPTVPEDETQTEEMPLPDGVEAPKDDNLGLPEEQREREEAK